MFKRIVTVGILIGSLLASSAAMAADDKPAGASGGLPLSHPALELVPLVYSRQPVSGAHTVLGGDRRT